MNALRLGILPKFTLSKTEKKRTVSMPNFDFILGDWPKASIEQLDENRFQVTFKDLSPEYAPDRPYVEFWNLVEGLSINLFSVEVPEHEDGTPLREQAEGTSPEYVIILETQPGAPNNRFDFVSFQRGYGTPHVPTNISWERENGAS